MPTKPRTAPKKPSPKRKPARAKRNDYDAIRLVFINCDAPVSEVARIHGVSSPRLRERAKAENWLEQRAEVKKQIAAETQVEVQKKRSADLIRGLTTVATQTQALSALFSRALHAAARPGAEVMKSDEMLRMGRVGLTILALVKGSYPDSMSIMQHEIENEHGPSDTPLDGEITVNVTGGLPDAVRTIADIDNLGSAPEDPFAD